MSTITIEEIQRDLNGFLRRIEAGEALLVVRNARPLAEIKPISTPATELRPYGLAAGTFAVPDDFDSPLPEEILQDFEGR